jgi:dolichol-phosphate mannosyltransferase
MEISEKAMVQLSIIVPTLNEAQNIDRLIEGIARAIPREDGAPMPYEIWVVDDNSDDATVAKARAWADRVPISVLERRQPPDLSASVLMGVDHANGKYIVVMDADGSHPPEALSDLVKPLITGSADLVIGSRHVSGGETKHWPWYRHLTSFLATCMAWPFTEVRDPMSGFFATTKERLAALPRSAKGYKILLELLVQGGDVIRTKEVPIRFEDRQHGKSKLSRKQQLIYLKRLMNLGGGRVSTTTARRFLGVGFVGMILDISVFLLMLRWLDSMATAHMISFACATGLNFTLNARWTFYGLADTDIGWMGRYARFLTIAVFALLLRGGVLISLTETLNWVPALAIVPAIVATTVVNYLGSAFYVFSSTESGIITRVRWHLAAIALFAYVFTLRLLYLPHLALLPDEMYYWVYAKHLDLSYLDHPPLTAWLIASSSALFGNNVFGVRAWLIPIVLSGALMFYRYGESMGGRTVGLLTMLALVSLPFFFLSGLVMTPDAAMIVAWAAALYYLKRLLIDEDTHATFGLGVAMGLGLLAKYSIALIGLGGLVFILLDKGARTWLRRPHLYIAIGIAMLIFSPVLWWNANRGWASFGFQFTRRLAENPDLSSHLIIVYAFLLLSPVFALAAFALLFRRRSGSTPLSREDSFMVTMTVVPLAVFFAYGLFSVTKFHWTLPAWIALIPLVMRYLMAHHLSHSTTPSAIQHGLSKIWAGTLMALVVCYGLLLHYLTLGLPGVQRTDWGTGYLAWPEITQEVERLAEDMESRLGRYPIVAATDKWGMSAALSFHGSGRLYPNITAQNIIGMSGSMWEYWFHANQDPDRPILLVHHKPELIDEAWIEAALLSVSPLQSITITPPNQAPLRLYHREANGFRPEQLRTPEKRPQYP